MTYRLLNWLTGALLISILSTMFNSLIAQPIKRLDDITTGSMVRQSDNNFELLPLIDTQVQIEVNGLIARSRVKQFFENPSKEVIEATYYFPLPEDSAVDSLQMKIGDRLIIGEIKEKQEAKKIYQAAKREGKKAALLEQGRANLFQSKVANINPGEVIEVILEYQQSVRFEKGQFSLRFPSTFTPRYSPKRELSEPRQTITETYLKTTNNWSQKPDDLVLQAPIQVNASERNDHQLSIDVSLDTGLPIADISSATHAIATTHTKRNQYDIRLQNYHVTDRDFELIWQVEKSAQPRLVSFHENDENSAQVYTQLLLMPPNVETAQLLPREVTYIIDHSGSMEGQSIIQAKMALIQAINRLEETDRFNIIGFNHQAKSLFHGTSYADDSARGWAVSYVDALAAEGGTEMLSALNLALQEPVSSGFVRQIIFLTDGAVSNEDELFSLIHQDLGDARLFTVGIGSAPNSYFMRKAAEFGRGSYTFIGSSKEVSSRMDSLLEQLRYPAMQNISLQWSDEVEYYPESLPDLYLGQPLSLVVKRPANDTRLNISGQRQGLDWQASVTLEGTPAKEATGVGKLWAKAKIDHLLDEQIALRSNDMNKAEVIALALTHQLMSPFTSFVAVEQRITRPANARLSSKGIPNLKPHGSQNFGYPDTALNWQFQLLIALGLLAIGLMLNSKYRLRLRIKL